MALAADKALESFLAAMTAAPRPWTVFINSPCTHAESLIMSLQGLSKLFLWQTAWFMSGYWVFEWLPQMMTPLILFGATPQRSAAYQQEELQDFDNLRFRVPARLHDFGRV
jgi:hypothetical protein